MRSLIARRLYLLGACVLAFALSALFQPSLAATGLSVSGTGLTDRVALLTSNDGEFDPESSVTVKWVGFVFLPRPAEVYFRIPAGVQARLNVAGDTVFDTYTAPAPDSRAVAYPSSGFSPIAFEVTTDPNHAGYVQAALEWQTPLGWQLAPAVNLYPQPVTPEAAQQTIQQSLYAAILFWTGAVCALALALTWLGPLIVEQRRIAAGLAIVVALAFALRLGFLRDYAAQPAADVLMIGSDHRGYQSNALDMLRGHWPPPVPFYVQPGMSLWLGALYSLLGPNIRAVQIIQFALGALTSILVFDLGRRTFDDWTGWAAAILWAIFPLPIFYESQLLTHGLEPVAGAALLCLWARALDRLAPPLRQSFWIGALGLALGASALLRPTFLVLAPFMALSLFLVHRPNLRLMLGRPALLALASLLPILPITWHNYQANGRFQLLTSNSDVTLYLGNNRDSTGLGEYSPAWYAAHMLVNQGKTTFFDQTLADIRNDPARWAQLMLRKTFLYLGDPELPNNVDFYTEGLAISPGLAALPLRFGAFMALAIAGAILALPKRTSDKQVLGILYWVLVTYLLSQILVTVLYHVFSRFRAPIYPVLPILAAFAIRTLLATLRQKEWRRFALALGALAASGLTVGLMPAAAESVMSRPVVSALPPDAIALNTPIGQSLTLLGHDPLPVVAPGDPFFITLYWQSSRPITADLYGTVQLFGGELKLTQGDQPLGTGSFPDYGTRQWQAGQIVKDTYFLRMPADAPTPLALTLLVAAYDPNTGNRLGETTFGLVPLTLAAPLDLPVEAIAVNARIGTATLSAYTIRDGTLTLYWQAGEPMAEDGIIFVHLFDSNNNFVVGSDSRPRGGLYSTLAWQPGEGIVDEHPLPAAPAGEYTIRIGMYDAVTQARFSVVNANGETRPDGVLELGKVTIPLGRNPKSSAWDSGANRQDRVRSRQPAGQVVCYPITAGGTKLASAGCPRR